MARSHPSEPSPVQVSCWLGVPWIAVGFEFSTFPPKSISFTWNNFWRKLDWSCWGSSQCSLKTSRAILFGMNWNWIVPMQLGWDEDGVLEFGLVVGVEIPVCAPGSPRAAAALSVNSQSWHHAPWASHRACFYLTFLPPLVLSTEFFVQKKKKNLTLVNESVITTWSQWWQFLVWIFDKGSVNISFPRAVIPQFQSSFHS